MLQAQVYTPDQVAQILQLNKNTVYELIKKKPKKEKQNFIWDKIIYANKTICQLCHMFVNHKYLLL